MCRSPRIWFLAALLAGAVLAGVAPPAHAQFRLRLEDVGSGMGVVVTDNGPGDIEPLLGAIVFSGSVPGGFTVNVTTGISKPIIGGVNNFAELDLNSVNVQTAGPGTLRITLEDTGYTGGPDGPLNLVALLGGVLVAPPGSTVTFQSWVNPLDLVPALGPDTFPVAALPALGAIPAGSVAAFGGSGITFGPGAYSAAATVDFTKAGPYALFSQTTVVFTGPGTVSYDENQQVVPVPAGLVLALTGLPVLGLGYWWRRLRKA